MLEEWWSEAADKNCDFGEIKNFQKTFEQKKFSPV
jgi:hypothetical protein